MTREAFAERVKNSVLLFDGAMGTMLYAKGVYINKCYDEINLSKPDLVREIHREYAGAGVDVTVLDDLSWVFAAVRTAPCDRSTCCLSER